MTTQRKYASLLAQKCFLSPSPHEIEALLGLGLDIDWRTIASHSNQTSLMDLAMGTIQDEILFKKWWSQFQKFDPAAQTWSQNPTEKSDVKGLSFAGTVMLMGRWSVARAWLQKDPGSLQDWQDFANHPSIERKCLEGWYQSFFDNLKDLIPGDVAAQMQKRRQDYLWLESQNVRDFEANAPALDAEKSLLWWGVICNHHKGNSNIKNVEKWRLVKLVESAKSGLLKWSPEQCRQALILAPPGFLHLHASALFGRELTVISNKITKELGGHLPEKWVEKELDELLQFNAGIGYHENEKEANAKRHANLLLRAIEGPDIDPGRAALWSTILETTFVKTTMFSQKSLALLQKAPLPQSAEELVFSLRKDALGQDLPRAAQLARGGSMAALVSHVLMAQPDAGAAQAFLSSFDWSNPSSAFGQKDIQGQQSKMVSWGFKGAIEAPSHTKNFFADLFWKSIFHIPQANQHHWLKKAADNIHLHVPLSFWDADFEKTLTTSMASKRTKEISTLLSKMSLVNQTAQVTDLASKTEKRKSKM